MVMPKNGEKKKIAVLVGGPSAEHEISLRTGRMILKNLDRKKYAAKVIKISANGRWPTPLTKLKKDFDVAFIAMHGEYGEDGTVQRILKRRQIPFTGSGIRASQLGMDKMKSLTLFKKAGLIVPASEMLRLGTRYNPRHYPVVIKPNDRGSSVGISIVERFQDFPAAIDLALKYSPQVIIQEYIKGREFTCGVIEMDGRLKPFLPTEIVPLHGRFFDYEAKYTSGATKEITPPRLSASEIKALQNIALKTHRAIGARGFSRTDMILGLDDKFYVLEINTIPGMTETSLLPQAAKAEGISFPQLLNLIIEGTIHTRKTKGQ